MKTPKEWFEEELSGEPLTQESVIEVLEMLQKETWNEALDKAAENAELVECDPMEFYVDKQSILKLKL